MIACTKNAILRSNEAAIKIILQVTAAKGGVKDRKFASKSFTMKGQQTRITVSIAAQCHVRTIYCTSAAEKFPPNIFHLKEVKGI